MAAFKSLTTQDVTINPFLANKGFDFVGSEITSSNVNIDIFQGINPTGSSMSTEAQPTGLITPQNTTGVYNSVKQLYYSNFLTSSWGDVVPTASILPGAITSDIIAYGPPESPRYDNYLQSTLTQSRNFPTGTGIDEGELTVVSIPQKLFGENIVPTTFEVQYTSSEGSGFKVIDDGDGNLVISSISSSTIALYGSGIYGASPYGDNVEGNIGDVVGQIFYSHGIAVFTTSSLSKMGNEVSASSTQLSDFDVHFSSSITIYEHQYRCLISENEFGYSLNPSLISSSVDLTGSQNDIYHDFATGSVFDPYITTVGLYNNNSDLIAVGKLSYPVPVSKYCDTTIMINFDT